MGQNREGYFHMQWVCLLNIASVFISLFGKHSVYSIKYLLSSNICCIVSAVKMFFLTKLQMSNYFVINDQI